jgi:STE24 endopeptidase
MGRRGAPVNTRVLAITTVLVAALLALLAWRLVPWGALPRDLSLAPVDTDFDPVTVASAHAFRGSLRALSIASLVLGVALLLLAAITPIGRRLVAVLPGGQVTRTALAVLVISTFIAVVRLPLAVLSERIARAEGLSTSTWGTWSVDQVKSFALSTVIAGGGVIAVMLLARWQPRMWWAAAAIGAAALTVTLSFLFPVVVEPLFNRFTPMPASELRTSLLALADRDGVAVSDVLIADASRRTTALNAYVSGFGATRRIVVYDTLLRDAPRNEVEMVVAHELGHAKERDVLTLTTLGAVAAALAVLVLALVAGSRVGAPSGVATVMAVFALLSLLAMPATNALSREVEARADRHALALMRDPQGFAEMQERLAVSNRADPLAPRWSYLLFASHPSTRERIALARWWAAREGVAVPGPLR